MLCKDRDYIHEDNGRGLGGWQVGSLIPTSTLHPPPYLPLGPDCIIKALEVLLINTGSVTSSPEFLIPWRLGRA